MTSSIILSAQEKKSSNEILDSYITELNLNVSTSEKFVTIYQKFNTQMSSESIENNAFNKLNKLRDLEIFAILTSEQNRYYKKLKKELEPSFRYRM